MTTQRPLDGLDVIISANAFVDGDHLARVVASDAQANIVLLRLESPLRVGDETYAHVVAKPRLGRDHIAALSERAVSSSVTWIPVSRFRESDPFDLSWWRGGAAAIADVRPL